MKKLFVFIIFLLFSNVSFARVCVDNVPVKNLSVVALSSDFDAFYFYLYQYQGEHGGRYFLNSKNKLKTRSCCLDANNKCNGYNTPEQAFSSDEASEEYGGRKCKYDKVDNVIVCTFRGENKPTKPDGNSNENNPSQPANPVTNPTPCGYMQNGKWVSLPCTNPDKPHNTPPANGGNDGGNGTGGSGGTGGSSGSGNTPEAGTGDNGTGNGTGNGNGDGGMTYIPPSNPPKFPQAKPRTHFRILVNQSVISGPNAGQSYGQYYLLPKACLNNTTFGGRSNCDWKYKIRICGVDVALPKDETGYCYRHTLVDHVGYDDTTDVTDDMTAHTDSNGNVTINNITINNNNNYGNAASSQPANPDNDDDLPKLDKGKITPGRGTLGGNDNGHVGGNGSDTGNGTDGNDGGNAAGTGSTAGNNAAGGNPNATAGNANGTPDGNCTPGTVGCTPMGGMGDVDAAINGNGDIGGGIGDGIGRHDIDISQVGKAGYFVEQGSCPAPRRFAFMGSSHEISYQPLCDIAVKIRPFVIFCGLFLAFGIVRAALVRQ